MIQRQLIPWKSHQLDSVFDSFEQELENMFSDAFDPAPFSAIGSRSSFPKINVAEEIDKYIIEATVPGYTKENIKIEIKDTIKGTIGYPKYLLISAKSENVLQEKTKKYFYKEIKASSFSKPIMLKDNVDVDKISATVVNGILTIDLPKLKATEPVVDTTKQIEIK
jgi:HSP20 family protein